MASSHTHRTGLETRSIAERSSPRGRRFLGLLVGVVLAAVTLPARGDEPPAPPAATPALQMQPATPGDAKKIARLEAFAASDTLDLQGRIDKIVTVGLAANEKSAPVRAAARRLLAGIAAETADGALAVIDAAERETSVDKGRLADLAVVALSIDSGERSSGPDAPSTAPNPIDTRQDALARTLDLAAVRKPRIYRNVASMAQLAGHDATLQGDTHGSVKVLPRIVQMTAFDEGSKTDDEALVIMEGVIDGLCDCLRDPIAFEMLIEKVWPAVDKIPRREAWKDKSSHVVQRLLLKTAGAVHRQTGRALGMHPSKWSKWWSRLDEAERAAALARPIHQKPPWPNGQLMVEGGARDDNRPSGETRASESYRTDAPKSPALPSVVFLYDKGFEVAGPDAPSIPKLAACARMIRELPQGTPFTVLLNKTDPAHFPETNVHVPHHHGIEEWERTLVPADAINVQKAAKFVLDFGDLGDTSDTYCGLAAAIELNPDRIIHFTCPSISARQWSEAEFPIHTRQLTDDFRYYYQTHEQDAELILATLVPVAQAKRIAITNHCFPIEDRVFKPFERLFFSRLSEATGGEFTIFSTRRGGR